MRTIVEIETFLVIVEAKKEEGSELVTTKVTLQLNVDSQNLNYDNLKFT
jgi:hypothetical protein